MNMNISIISQRVQQQWYLQTVPRLSSKIIFLKLVLGMQHQNKCNYILYSSVAVYTCIGRNTNGDELRVTFSDGVRTVMYTYFFLKN